MLLYYYDRHTTIPAASVNTTSAYPSTMARTWKLFPDDDRMGIASPSESLPCDRPIVQHFSCPGGCAINEIKGRNHPPLEDENLDGGLLANNRAGSLPLTRSRSAYRLSSRIARSECNSLQMVLTPCNSGLRHFATAGFVRLCRRSHPAVIRNIRRYPIARRELFSPRTN